MRWPLALLLAACLATSACSNRTARATGKRTIVIGVDGMDPVLVETHLASLPNLDRLRQQGAVPAANGTIGQSVF